MITRRECQKGEKSPAKLRALKLKLATPRPVGAYFFVISLCYDIELNPGPKRSETICAICGTKFKKEKGMWGHKGILDLREMFEGKVDTSVKQRLRVRLL